MKVQGTDFYYIDPVTGDLNTVECVTSIDGAGSTRGTVSVPSCISDTKAVAQKLPGDLTPGTMTIGVNADPKIESHLRLHELLSSTDPFPIAIGLSDGARNDDDESLVPATIGSDGDFDLPTGRSWLVTKGFVSAFPWSLAGNAVVTTTASIELSEPVQAIAKVVS
jgi:hypothetical protein